MRAAAAAALALVGLGVGVLVNLLIDRVPLRRSLLPVGGGRRRCGSVPAADAADGAAHGTPALAWPLRRAACGACGRPAPARYPLVEGAAGLLFAAATLRFGADWALPAYLVFFASLLAVSVIDLGHHIIPNRIVYPTILVSVPLLSLAAVASHDGGRLRQALLGAVLAWAALLVVHLVSPAGMGFGDVRLAFVLGLFLGWLGLGHVLTGIFLGFLLGSVTGLVLVGLRVRRREDSIPFGPFLAAGAALAVFAGGPLIRWWLGG